MSIDYSIIIPAYNEEELLEETIKHLKKAMATVSLKGEIVVTNNNSTDRTAEIAKNLGANVVFEAVNQISRARNTGVSIARGRYFIFVDADTIVPEELLQNTIKNLESGEYCGGGATVTSHDIPVAVKGVLKRWNTISTTFNLAAGCYVYSRRDDFEACGGFSDKVYASEEIWFSMALKRKARKHKRKFKIINNPDVITSGRKLVWFSYSYQSALLLTIFIFPFITRFKWVCAYWYKRPQQKDINKKT